MHAYSLCARVYICEMQPTDRKSEIRMNAKDENHELWCIHLCVIH